MFLLRGLQEVLRAVIVGSDDLDERYSLPRKYPGDARSGLPVSSFRRILGAGSKTD
jgi:hypothetical protein